MYMSSIGLFYGLSSVFLGQIITVSFLYSNRKSSSSYDFFSAIWSHFSQIEGLLMLSLYLSVSWYGKWLPSSYYLLENQTIQWKQVAMQLIVQDAGQYAMHRLEHHWKPLYRLGHQYHHKHIHPRWFDAFDGSWIDTSCMILIPLVVTSQVVRNANTWSYMAFGTIYSSWLVLIHSERDHFWEPWFQKCLIGTSHDHQLHHRYYTCNYGHLFMWWDAICGTYQNH